MPAPFHHKPVSELIGSWPIAVAPGFVNPQILPNSVSAIATILGTKRQPVAGFDLSPGGLSLNMYLGPPSGPTLHVVDFPANGGDIGAPSDFWSLAAVITRFTTAATPAAPAGTARDSDGFLELRDSANLGSNSGIRLESITTAEEVFSPLGLYSEAVALGGDIRQAQHVDPTRQIAEYGQLGMMHGERFSSDVVNRLALQLGVNVDRVQGLLDEKRVAVRVEEAFLNPPGHPGGQGFQLNTTGPNVGRPVYTGKVGSPTTEELMDTVQILDMAGNEFGKEMVEDLASDSNTYAGFIELDPLGVATGRQVIDAGGAHTYLVTDPDQNVYVIAGAIAGHPLSGKYLKVIDYLSANQVVVTNIDPATGDPAPITAADGTWTARRGRVHNVRAEVEGFYLTYSAPSTFGTSLEQVQSNVTGMLAVTRIEKNNRVYVAGATFVTSNVTEGDLVEWTPPASNDPYSNVGFYRVGRIIDENTLELLSSDFGPVYLNPNTAGGLGSIQVKTDGDFHLTPFIKLARGTDPTTQPLPETGINFVNGRGAFPALNEEFKVSYMVSKTLRQALEEDPSFLSGDVRYGNEATAQVQQILMKMAGPSTETYDQLVRDYLYSDEWVSHEKHESRLDVEHYEQGRHSTIRPDVIDMYPEVAGTTHIMRIASGDAATVPKFQFKDATDKSHVELRADGSLHLLHDTIAATPAVRDSGHAFLKFSHIDEDDVFSWEHATDGSNVSLLKLSIEDDGSGTNYDNVFVVASRNQPGNVGINMRASLADTGAAGEPQANFHIRGRYLADTELIRLEGFDSGINTVAMTFKPRINDGLYGFIEFDENNDDWFMNFVTTDLAEADAIALAGGDEIAGFRWWASKSTVATLLAQMDYDGMRFVDVALLAGASTGEHDRRVALTGASWLGAPGGYLGAEKWQAFANSWILKLWAGVTAVGRDKGINVGQYWTGSAYRPTTSIGGDLEGTIAASAIQRAHRNAVIYSEWTPEESVLILESSLATGFLGLTAVGSTDPEEVGFAFTTSSIQARVGSVEIARFHSGGIAIGTDAVAPAARVNLTGSTPRDQGIAFTPKVTPSDAFSRPTLRWSLTALGDLSSANLRLAPYWDFGVAAATGTADPSIGFTRNAGIGAINWSQDDPTVSSSGFFIESSVNTAGEDSFRWKFAPAGVSPIVWTTRATIRNTSPHFDVAGDVSVDSGVRIGQALGAEYITSVRRIQGNLNIPIGSIPVGGVSTVTVTFAPVTGPAVVHTILDSNHYVLTSTPTGMPALPPGLVYQQTPYIDVGTNQISFRVQNVSQPPVPMPTGVVGPSFTFLYIETQP